MTDTNSERGQLILAGAVSFALILIAIAVVFSTSMFTASVGSSGTAETVSDSTGVEQSVENTTAELLDRASNQSEFNKSMSGYGNLATNSSSDSGPTFVDVSVLDVDDSGDLDWAEIRIVYETSSVQRETVTNVSAP